MTLSAVRNANTIAITDSVTDVTVHYSLTETVRVQVSADYAQLLVNGECAIQLSENAQSVHYGNSIFGASTVADLIPLIDAKISPLVGSGGGGGGSIGATDVAAGIDSATKVDTVITKLTSINDKSPILGQALNSNSLPVVLTAAQLAALTPPGIVGSVQSGVWSVLADIGLEQPLTDTQLRATSLPLPTGASTLAKQDSIIARLEAIEARLQSGYRPSATITRGANTDTYIANDIYGNLFELQNAGPSGGFVILTDVRVTFNLTAVPTGMADFTLFLYAATPPSAYTDNGAFSYPDADRGAAGSPIMLTPNGIDLGAARLSVGGGSVVLDASNINRSFKLASGSTSLWGYLVTRRSFPPAAVSETATIDGLFIGV